MALIDRLRAVNDRLSKLPERFGDPRYPCTVMITPAGSYITLSPRPKVTQVSNSTAQRYLSSGVEISLDDFMLEGVSRQHSLETVKQSKYLLNAYQDGLTWKGEKAEVIDVEVDEMMTWNLIVHKYRSK